VVFIHKTADGQILSAQDERGALAISPTIVLSIYYQSDVAGSGGVRVEGGESSGGWERGEFVFCEGV